MMRTVKVVLSVCLIVMTGILSNGQTKRGNTVVLGGEIMPKDSTKTSRFKNRLIAPKNEFQLGLSAMYTDLSSANSDYMLLLQCIGAGATVFRVAPEFAYTFADNHAIGLRLKYMSVKGMLDTVTADLLGNFSLTLGDFNAVSSSAGVSVYQRTYLGLDDKGRVGIFWDYVLGATAAKSQFYSGAIPSGYSLSTKYHLGFSPGLVFFPINNVSIQASLCLADLSYNRVTVYDGTADIVGRRNAWKAQASLNLLDISFGLTIHL